MPVTLNPLWPPSGNISMTAKRVSLSSSMTLHKDTGVEMCQPSSLRTLHLLVVPIDGELVKAVGAFDIGVPARVWSGQTNQGDAVLLTTADDKLRRDIGSID